MPTGLLPTGLSVETYEETRADIVAQLRVTVSQTLNLEEDALLGNVVSIVATKYRELGEAIEAVYGSFDPDGNTGASQDHVAAITGTTREDATYSTVTATVTVEPGTYAAGTLVAHVVGNPSARFESAAPVTWAGPGNGIAAVAFRAQTAGPVLAPAGTLTVIAGAVVGWVAVTNVTDADVGRDVELDSEMRQRREDELSGQGSTSAAAIRAHLTSTLPFLESVVVLENETDAVVDTMPPHSVEVVKLGGDVTTDDAVALAIWESKAGGVLAHGSTVVVITDSQGIEHEVGFTTATNVLVYVRFELDVLADEYVGDAEFIAQTVLDANAYYSMRRDVRRSKLSAIAHGVRGVFGVSSVELSTDGVSWSSSDITIGIRARARFAEVRTIVVSATPVEE